MFLLKMIVSLNSNCLILTVDNMDITALCCGYVVGTFFLYNMNFCDLNNSTIIVTLFHS